MKKILIVADVPNWAWAKKAAQLKKHITEFNIDIFYSTIGPLPEGYDLYHTFEVNQVHGIPPGVKSTTGITAHVWQTWEGRHGAGTVKRWAAQASAFHANSMLLKQELEAYLGYPIYYVPNGVDETFYKRLRPHSTGKLIVGHVGKPNPRKGHDIIEEACKKANVEFRTIRRTSKDALNETAMREFYQDIHVLAVASDMDGTPNPALEAAACGCAVVSNPIGNMPEFIDSGKNGLLVARDVNAMCGAFRMLSGNLSRVVIMGEEARKTVEHAWTWKTMSNNYADMWREVLAK